METKVGQEIMFWNDMDSIGNVKDAKWCVVMSDPYTAGGEQCVLLHDKRTGKSYGACMISHCRDRGDWVAGNRARLIFSMIQKEAEKE